MIWENKQKIEKAHPLIHCITHPIVINDCANILLAFHASPIMAPHPDEVKDITHTANALALSLGNFDSIRAQAMKNAFEQAQKDHVPTILDLVGIACSPLRKNFAHVLLQQGNIDILKGNVSEMKALANQTNQAHGVDAGENETIEIGLLKDLAKTYHTTILCTGKTDKITDGTKVIYIDNGDPLLSALTGTGCMLNVVCAAFLSQTNPLDAAKSACILFEIAAEIAAEKSEGPGTFHMHLFDAVYNLKEADLSRMKVRETE